MNTAASRPSKMPKGSSPHSMWKMTPIPNTTPAMTRKEPSIHGMSALSSLRCVLNASKICLPLPVRAARLCFSVKVAASVSCFPAISPGYGRGARLGVVGPLCEDREVPSASSPRSRPGLLDGLDPEQQAAASAPRGPVCVLAGAGTGKTRTITHRIAHLVGSGHVAGGQVLAVTYTARAAGEMRARLRGLGVEAAQALTFHAAARRQLRYFWPRVVGDRPWDLLDNKFRFGSPGANRVGLSPETEVIRDLAGEIEWAKASLVGPDDYPAVAARTQRDTPAPVTQVAEVYRNYEKLKDSAQVLDFDDLLLHTTAALEEHGEVAEEFRDRYRCFVVDEYQDVTPLQQRLLDAWLGERDDLTVVGDANQTIYSFGGASPRPLLEFTRRF